MTIRVNINGDITDAEQARISVFDRGFLYGDSVYEVMRTYAGELFAKPRHLDRLWRSAERLEITLPDRKWLREQIDRTIAAAGNPESYCRVIVTRGSGPLTLDPTQAIDPLCVILVQPFQPVPDWMYQKGIRATIAEVRRNLRSALDPAIKSGNYLNSVLAMGEARRAGFDDALLLDVNGRVTEATSSNVFVVQAGRLCTPALETGLLEGVTRGLILELARQHGIAYSECELRPADLYSADEVLITSTLKEIMPVVQVDDRRIGAGDPGPMVQRLRKLFQTLANQPPGDGS